MNKSLTALELLLSDNYAGSLAPEHLADLRKSGLRDETIQVHRIRSVPPGMIAHLIGFDVSAIRSAYLLPFPDLIGGFIDHIRLRVFPSFKDRLGRTVKYLGPAGMPPRLFFPILTLGKVLHSVEPLWCVEGVKKSIAVCQLGLPAIGFEGIEAWHTSGSCELLPDFGAIPLADRVVELVPDSDWQINPNVRRGVERYARALAARGARSRLVVLPEEVAA